ncbi:amidase [Algihabitans albus]|uniref:amidase n=1 Tax=Algihabitans albus TaxID=2164067 RepID=UPI000E5D3C78|nr:amidase family protein [Algihabitans albus]
MTDLCDRSAVELRALMRRREISPVELLDSCLARIEAVNPKLNAVVALDAPAARAAAEAAEALFRVGDGVHPLTGLPVGVKDLNETKGLRTTFGSPLFAEHVPAADAGVVRRLRAAGGIVAAKTNTPEFGAGANTDNAVYGFTGNPFDPMKTCAGSSGGSAVALATSMLPLCNGSDLGGSLRTPAAFCGVVGLRPTPGLVAKSAPAIPTAPLSVEGPMGRSVADLALLLSGLAGADPDDPYSRPLETAPLADLQPVDLGQLKVAVSEDLGFAPVDDEIRSLFRARLAGFRHLFRDVQNRDPEMAEANRVFEVLRSIGFLAAHLEKVERHPDKVGANVANNVKLGLTFTARDVAWASKRHGEIARDFTGLMEEVDLLIAPGASAKPFAKGESYPAEINGKPLDTYIHWVAISYGLTLTGHPVLCLPCGLDADGMPFGLQIVGRRWDERRLLSIGAALEAALAAVPGCARPLPDLARLMT